MGEIAEKYSNKLFITSDNPRSEKIIDIIKDIKSGLKGQVNVQIDTDRKKAIISALSQMDENTTLIILGKELREIVNNKV